MSPIAREEDAFGRQLIDHHEGRPDRPEARLERDDGWSGPASPADDYFTEYADWPSIEANLIKHAHGRVLDLGAGAGRHARYLQCRRHDVVAVDHSPGAVDVCRARGVRRAELRDLLDVPAGDPFDTVLMLCQNLGLAGTLARTRELLALLHDRTRPGAVILGDTVDPLMFKPPSPHREYHEASPRQGRDTGQVRLRWRYDDLVTPWHDILLLPRRDLEPLVTGSGWRVEKIYPERAPYGVVLARE